MIGCNLSTEFEVLLLFDKVGCAIERASVEFCNSVGGILIAESKQWEPISGVI